MPTTAHASTPQSEQPPTKESPQPVNGPPLTPRVMLTVEAAAELLSLSRTRVYALIKTGDISSVRVGNLRRVPADALTRYVRQLADAQSAA